ncbi:MAG TPA: hypothetical protein VK696_06705 [Steroidobacteraceae bacterium]|jgi:hypothetical protein|nr:hypothetical protein [Steroidobacteraceae bacterium]
MTQELEVDLGKYSYNAFSQWGEDGIVEKLFSLAKVEKGYFVEFGAWDGKYLSNTYNLVGKGWSGLYVEADKAKFGVLGKIITSPEISLVNCYVEADGPNSLDNILDRVRAPQTIDVLSIDVDSIDLSIWIGLRAHRARCVIIEYNPTIPFDTEFVCPKGRLWGNGALSIKRFAEGAGYALVAITGTNLVFVDRTMAQQLSLVEVGLDTRHTQNVYRYFWGYDGTMLCVDPQLTVPNPETFPIPWHHFVMAQPIPAWWRVWTGSDKNKTRERLGSLFQMLILRPITFARFILARLNQ